MTRALGAAAVALVALFLYTRTLLPGFDLGDSASFQADMSLTALTPRQAYPLYLTIGRLAARVSGGDPARALNLTSAVFGALACGTTVWVGSLLTGSSLAGIFAGLLLASSYTFWSQAVVAEVYTLHVFLIALCCAALLMWRQRPSVTRLGIFFGLYALSLGHHLSMILLAPPFVLFLLLAARRNLRSVLSLRALTLALLVAAAGSLQYLTMFQSLWAGANPPADLTEGLRVLWFDVTKSDWRESMVLGIPSAAIADRFAMWWFDLRQQAGLAGVLLAAVGAATLGSAAPAALLIGGYLVTAAFAFSYNVGDVHVFFLPSHLMLVLLAACGGVTIARAAGRALPSHSRTVTALILTCLVAYPIWRVWDTYPAVDRSADVRPERALDQLTEGLDGVNEIFAADLNWQLQNGLAFYAQHQKPGLSYFRLAEHLLQAPFIVHDNRASGRDVVLSEGSAARLLAAFGPRYTVTPDTRVDTPELTASVVAIPRGTIYALTRLRPTRDAFLDAHELDTIVRHLSGSAFDAVPEGDYLTIVGVSGELPTLVQASFRPFRVRHRVSGLVVDVRMESWLSTDTIRRAGFAHVIVNRRHALIAERGLSLVTLAPDGSVTGQIYAGNIFQPQIRFMIR